MFSLTRSSVPPGEHGPTSTKGDFSASISTSCHGVVESIAQAEPRARGRAGWHVCVHGTPRVGAEGCASSTASWQRPQFHGGITHDAQDKQHHREPLGPQPLPGAVPRDCGAREWRSRRGFCPCLQSPQTSGFSWNHHCLPVIFSDPSHACSTDGAGGSGSLLSPPTLCCGTAKLHLPSDSFS